MDSSEALLKHLGLKEYEAKAYLALLKLGPLVAEKISEKSGVPLARIYDTMSSLSMRGLIIVKKTRPKIYKACTPERIEELLVEDEKKKLSKRISLIRETSQNLLQTVSNFPEMRIDDVEETFAHVKRKINMESQWRDIHTRAKKEVLVFAGDLYWINKNRERIARLVNKGVDYRVLFSKVNKENLANIKNLSLMGIKIRYNKDLDDLRGVIVDERCVSIAQVIGKDKCADMEKTEKTADFTTIIISHRILVNVFKKHFMHLWKTAKPVNKLLK